MADLTTPQTAPEPIKVGDRTVIPLVEAVGPALSARAAYPRLHPRELATLLDEYGDTYADTQTLPSHLPLGGYLHRDHDTFTLTDPYEPA